MQESISASVFLTLNTLSINHGLLATLHAIRRRTDGSVVHFPKARQKTKSRILGNITTHTTFTGRNVSVSSAVVNPFSRISKRARESFTASARLKQKPVQCTAMIARKLDDKIAATPSVKICIKLRATGSHEISVKHW